MSIARHLIPVGLAFSGGAAASCSLMLTREEASRDVSGGGAGAEMARAGGVGASTLDAGDAANELRSDAGPAQPPVIAQPDAEVPDMINARVDGVLRLAFVEDPEEDFARLQLVDVPRAFLSSDAPEVWRRSLGARAQAGSALDFAWSPDGRHLALRHESLNVPRLAFFAAPLWTELPLTELGEPASQPDFFFTPNYVWSPDGSVLAIELASDEGPFVGAYRVGPTGATALTPVGFSSPPESMAWASPSRLFVLHETAGGREIIVLEPGADALVQERLLTSPIMVSLALRPAPGGILGASDSSSSFLYFWTAAGRTVQHDPRSYPSNEASLVAFPGEPPQLTLQAIGGGSSPLASLPDCPTVLTWIEGPVPGSLAGSKLACHALVEGAAVIQIHGFDTSATPSTVTLDDDRIRNGFAVEADWAAHARSFSPRGEWLALTTSTSDAFVDLRVPGSPTTYARDVEDPGATARTFSPTGSHLLVQRGQQLVWLVLGAGPEQPPGAADMPNTAAGASACSITRNASNWCGAPHAGEVTGPRWAATDDIAASLTQNEGLILISRSSDGGMLSEPISTCGSSCVRGYAFSP
jgi:hypothetical protein